MNTTRPTMPTPTQTSSAMPMNSALIRLNFSKENRWIEEIVGHQQKLQPLLQAIEEDRLPSTFLFVGPHGIGKKTSALALAQVLMCEKTKLACGVCGPCLRVRQNSSEGVLLIQAEKNQIKINQAHQVHDFLSLHPISRSRVIIIDGADLLNIQAANSLLKILEEPPPRTYFFMIAPSSHHVLPTLRSRSQVILFSSLSFDDLKKCVDAPEWILRASQGSLEKISAFENSEELQLRESASEFLFLLAETPYPYLKEEWKEKIKDRQEALHLNKYLIMLVRDALYYVLNQKNYIIHKDKTDLFEKMSSFKSEELGFLLQKLIHAETALLQNRDVQLVYEELFIKKI